ncbi:MAG TPA: right-handed parallel beta-helix repeat-containing protein [Gemmatimonadales bacterium]|jgi:nitrous oxidase accessory protein NosD
MRLAVLLLVLPTLLSAQTVAYTAYTPGMTLSHSARVRPGTYPAPAGDSAALTIRGSDLVVDLTGVTLVGSDDREHPDQFHGTAIRIDGGRSVTVKGVHARGYQVGILARHVTRLSLLDNDLSYNWRPRLYSGIQKESLVDWLDYHNNEHDEWLRYGAGIYLADITIGEIRGNRVTQGMDGLMLVRSTGVRAWNNTFSYNSGVGIGMYRAARNYIMHNRIDWNVRGYSFTFYNRGQDSGGLLMYEQSSNNIVAYNSVTHSGDGLFLWAGQSTMDTGLGGSNDNLFYQNDFSYAPTNGIEATFSRNMFVANRVAGNWHGLWGGYSYGSVILGNHFYDNVEAISIEHGQQNRIAGNRFEGDSVGIHLWANRVEPSDWGYPKHRDTRSRDYTITNNTFSGERVGAWVANTQRAQLEHDAFHGVDTLVRTSGDTAGWSFLPTERDAPAQSIPAQYRVAALPGGMVTRLPRTAIQGRAAIIVDEWGPYDWRSPKLWPAGRDDSLPLKLRVLGPVGRWRVVGQDGVASLSADSGRIGDALVVTPQPGREGNFAVRLEYRGGAVTTRFGKRVAAGAPLIFGWSRFAPPTDWHLRFLVVDSARARRVDTSMIAAIRQQPAVAVRDTNQLDLTWYTPPWHDVPATNVITEATATVVLPVGNYLLRTIADDAVRVFVNDSLVLDDWHPGESHVKATTFHATGNDRLRVEHLQLDGWYELRVDIEPQP